MSGTKKVGSAGRFKVRYGTKIRKMIIEVETIQKAKHKCPTCLRPSLERKFAGIWECKKCHLKFAGKAYKPV